MAKTTADYVAHIVDLAMEAELEDPIDWGMLTLDEQTAFNLIASDVVNLFYDKYDEVNGRELLLAAIVKLVVENFTLNLKLRER